MPGAPPVVVESIAQKISASKEINASEVAAPNGDVMFNPSIDIVEGKAVISETRVVCVLNKEKNGTFNIFSEGKKVGKVEFKAIPFKYHSHTHYHSPKTEKLVPERKEEGTTESPQ